MFFLQDVLTNERIQIYIHMFKHQIYILTIFSLQNLLQYNNIRMPKLQQKHNLSICPLRIGRIVKCIKIFL